MTGEEENIYVQEAEENIYTYLGCTETRGILNRITGLSGTTDDFRLLIEELGDCRVTGVHSKGPLSIDKC